MPDHGGSPRRCRSAPRTPHERDRSTARLTVTRRRPPERRIHRPDYLRGRHLLFLGCGYTNWLARFFIRTLRNERFASANPQKTEVIVDEVVSGDTELAVFLRHYDSQVFRALHAIEFVDQLYQRSRPNEPAASPGRRPTSARCHRTRCF